MNRYQKLLSKLRPAEKKAVDKLWIRLNNNELKEIKIKKLKGFKNYYRIRIGKLRIVFAKEENKNTIINIDYRKNIYRKK